MVEKADNSHLISEYQLKINPTPNNNNLPHPSLLAPTSVDLEHTKKTSKNSLSETSPPSRPWTEKDSELCAVKGEERLPSQRRDRPTNGPVLLLNPYKVMIPHILGHYHIMTNFDCPKTTRTPRVAAPKKSWRQARTIGCMMIGRKSKLPQTGTS